METSGLSTDPQNCRKKQLLGAIFLTEKVIDILMLFPLGSLFVFLELRLQNVLILLPWNRTPGVPTPAAHPSLPWPWPASPSPCLASAFYKAATY